MGRIPEAKTNTRLPSVVYYLGQLHQCNYVFSCIRPNSENYRPVHQKRTTMLILQRTEERRQNVWGIKGSMGWILKRDMRSSVLVHRVKQPQEPRSGKFSEKWPSW